MNSVNLNIYKNLKEILKSNQSIFEILYVFHNLKRVCRLTLNKNELKSFIQFCKYYNLHFTLNNYKLLSKPDIGKGNFINRGNYVPFNYPGGDYIIYISLIKEDSIVASEKELKNEELGELLGYPSCCIKFFVKNFYKQSKKQMDFILPSLKKFDVYPFYNNRCIRCFGITILSHFPCEPDCKDSEKIGKKYFDLIKKYDPKLAGIYEKELKSFVIYTEYDGVFYSTEYKVKRNIVDYKNLKFTIDNSLYKKLVEANRIEIKNYNNFIVNGSVYKGTNYGVFIFK